MELKPAQDVQDPTPKVEPVAAKTSPMIVGDNEKIEDEEVQSKKLEKLMKPYNTFSTNLSIIGKIKRRQITP